MTRRMLIDASQSEETRVVVLQGNRLEEFDYDSESKKQLKGNIYLAKVTRVEPSLQAAFVEYGGNRHGFLAFNEIHPDYYKIPVADREQLIAEEAALDDGDEFDEGETVETVGGDELEDVERRRTKLRRRYKIQEVIKRGQVLLVQVVKEERGNKGAALTTYLSLPGRYCVLMPNTARGGGISRKITNARDRKRLKKILDDIGIPAGMAVIVRTAGSERTKAEIKRDFEYMLRLWDTIRTNTLESTAPALIYEEANLIKRAIRDMYTKEIDEILIEGDNGYRVAKDFMRTLMPSHAKRVQPYKDGGVPVFNQYQVDGQIDAIHSPEVKLRSGGYIVLHQTEALVAIDVNSGRATRERHIEETALKTNLEAADEIARQLRLRDLAGLIVIDYIDMEETRNNHAVERRLKDALRTDRARIQVGRISHFGLLEMSRQRLRPSLAEMSSEICQYCGGTGYIRSIEWTALHVLRSIEEEALRKRATELSVDMPGEAALYILNHKRPKLSALEDRYGIKIDIVVDDKLVPPNFSINSVRGKLGETVRDDDKSSESERPGRRKRRPRRRRRPDDEAPAAVEAETADPAEDAGDGESEASESGESSNTARRRKRGRRGGRRRGRRTRTAEENETQAETPASDDSEASVPAEERAPGETASEEKPSEEALPEQASPEEPTPQSEAPVSAETESATPEPAKARRPRRSRRRTPSKSTDKKETVGANGSDSGADETTKAPPRRRRARSSKSKAPAESKSKPTEKTTAAPDSTEPAKSPARAKEPKKPPRRPADAGANDAPIAQVQAEPPAIQTDSPQEKRTGWWNRVLG